MAKAGTAVCDDGIVIDLSAMRADWVDPAGRPAMVQGGALWGDVDHETQAHGLATTGGIVGHTGVAGLTLGGGIGFLMRKHGLGVDNLVSAEVVTADATIVRASADEHPDLFWALRGGGGNFGVVTTFRVHLAPRRAGRDGRTGLLGGRRHHRRASVLQRLWRRRPASSAPSSGSAPFLRCRPFRRTPLAGRLSL